MTPAEWAAAHSRRAPAPLRDRVLATLESAGIAPAPPEALAAAGDAALDRVLRRERGGRELALDLLSADALITLALEAQAEADPAGLEAFAARRLDAAFQA